MSEELSGNALVQACAENVMGWAKISIGDKMPDKFPVYQVTSQAVCVFRSKIIDRDYWIWNPLASIDDAWEIRDRMRKLGWYLNLTDHKFEINATFYRSDGDEYRDYDADSKNPREAICRAALKALECANQ